MEKVVINDGEMFIHYKPMRGDQILMPSLVDPPNNNIILNMTFDTDDGIYNKTFAQNLGGLSNGSIICIIPSIKAD